jgi:hypothetical protein
MIELIKQALEEYFSEYKQYHVILLIAFLFLTILIQVIQAIWISRKIENFKYALRKSEIKFSRYHELQVEALKSIYEKLSVFHSANSILFEGNYEANNHDNYKAGINRWIKSYVDCYNAFSRQKILLPEALIKIVQRTLKDFEEVKDIILSERENLDYLEMEYNGDRNAMYDFQENELSLINKKISQIKSKDSIVKSELNIKELRANIEEYFRKMNE